MLWLLLCIFFTLPLYASSWSETTLADLTIREKIGQLIMVAAASDFGDANRVLAQKFLKDIDTMRPEMIEDLIRTYAIGGIIFLMRGTPEGTSSLIDRYQSLTQLPLLIGLDAEWGLSMRLDGTLRFPKNMTLGACADEQLVFELGKEIGRQLKILGVHINFSPVVDINSNPANPVIHMRSFGESKEMVARLGAAYARGLAASGILACAKHFPGHGDTLVDSHYGLPCIHHSEERLHEIELYPFKELIAQGVPAIMTAHLRVPTFDADKPASLSYVTITSLLRETLGFQGLVISDDLGMGALKTQPDAIVEACRAGTDILLCPRDVPGAIDLLEKAVHEGALSQEMLDVKVLKILRAKEQLGLHTGPFQKSHDLQNLITDEGRTLKRDLYEGAMTLVSNSGILPLALETPVLQIGGSQNQPFTKPFVQSYYVPSQATDQDITHLMELLVDTEKLIIGIFEMNPLASQRYGLSESTLQLLELLHAAQKKLVIILFGSPYSLSYVHKGAVLVVAYEDDEDAQGAAIKLLTGFLKTHGRLPVTASDLFPRGSGL